MTGTRGLWNEFVRRGTGGDDGGVHILEIVEYARVIVESYYANDNPPDRLAQLDEAHLALCTAYYRLRDYDGGIA